LGSAYDATTNYRFTPTVAGYYQVNAIVNSSTSTSYGAVWIYKNGSNSANVFFNNEFGLGGGVSKLFYMNGSTDYLELYASLSSNGTIVLGSYNTSMNGSLVRAA
jgi:hypothetical protein